MALQQSRGQGTKLGQEQSLRSLGMSGAQHPNVTLGEMSLRAPRDSSGRSLLYPILADIDLSFQLGLVSSSQLDTTADFSM